MKLETSTHSSQVPAAMAIQIAGTSGPAWKLTKFSPIAEPKVSSTSEIAEAITIPAMIAGQST